MSNADQLIWIRSQSRLEAHQRERTVAYLAVAGKSPVSSRLSFLAERVCLDVVAKEKENIDGMMLVFGEGGRLRRRRRIAKGINYTKIIVKD